MHAAPLNYTQIFLSVLFYFLKPDFTPLLSKREKRPKIPSLLKYVEIYQLSGGYETTDGLFVAFDNSSVKYLYVLAVYGFIRSIWGLHRAFCSIYKSRAHTRVFYSNILLPVRSQTR